MATGEAVAAPVDNADNGIFIFYDNPGSPFLDFSSSTSVSSEAMGTNPASFFKADIASNGATTFQNSLDMRRHLTALAIGDDITVQLTILDIQGFIDCSTPSATCEVDWEIEAELNFENLDPTFGWAPAACTTDPFTIDIDGDWDNASSGGFVIPSLSGTGSQQCYIFSGTLNSFFGLGANGAKLNLYKFEGRNAVTGLLFQGS